MKVFGCGVKNPDINPGLELCQKAAEESLLPRKEVLFFPQMPKSLL